jgi:hypothetical protein
MWRIVVHVCYKHTFKAFVCLFCPCLSSIRGWPWKTKKEKKVADTSQQREGKITKILPWVFSKPISSLPLLALDPCCLKKRTIAKLPKEASPCFLSKEHQLNHFRERKKILFFFTSSLLDRKNQAHYLSS